MRCRASVSLRAANQTIPTPTHIFIIIVNKSFLYL